MRNDCQAELSGVNRDVIIGEDLTIGFLFSKIADQREFVQKVTRDGDSGRKIIGYSISTCSIN